MRRSLSAGISPFKAGLIAIAISAIAVYAIFTKSVPLRDHYEIAAVFQNANVLHSKSPVRISGIDVGRVTGVERYGDTDMAKVTMRIEDGGQPVHSDATFKIRPRLFLEGNFYIEMQPGSPRAPELAEDALVPVAQTSRAVQIDEVLGALQTDTRADLRDALVGFGEALDAKPTAAEDAAQPPQVRGLSGAQALNKTFDTSVQSLRDSAIVNDALAGEAPNSLSDTIGGFAKATRAAAQNSDHLRDLVTHFGQTMAAIASESDNLAKTVELLGPTAVNANKGFTSLLAALPPTRQFARDLLPGVQETPATIEAARPWLAQALPLLSDAELGGLLDELAPATEDLAKLGHESRLFLPVIDEFNRCVNDVILPTGNLEVDDGPHSAGVENYKEFWYAMVGQASEAQHFDGNGSYLRLSAAPGNTVYETGKTKYDGTTVFFKPSNKPLETRPAFPNKQPQLRRDVACHTQPVPDVNGPASIGPADGSLPDAPPPDAETPNAVTMGQAARALVAALTGGDR